KNVDVTNAQARTACGQMGATLGEPSRDLVGRQARGQRSQLRPVGKKAVLNGPIVGPEYPIRAALHERVSEMLEPLGGPHRRAPRGAGAGPKPLSGRWWGLKPARSLSSKRCGGAATARPS